MIQIKFINHKISMYIYISTKIYDCAIIILYTFESNILNKRVIIGLNPKLFDLYKKCLIDNRILNI